PRTLNPASPNPGSRNPGSRNPGSRNPGSRNPGSRNQPGPVPQPGGLALRRAHCQRRARADCRPGNAERGRCRGDRGRPGARAAHGGAGQRGAARNGR
ncbi:hypothetical protein, partial [Hymenobacter sp.]|uniref:hypothetical protein n=1 Tax=Hymenobacter sp. TaxID=1898978 RepID=UPI0038D371BB